MGISRYGRSFWLSWTKDPNDSPKMPEATPDKIPENCERRLFDICKRFNRLLEIISDGFLIIDTIKFRHCKEMDNPLDPDPRLDLPKIFIDDLDVPISSPIANDQFEDMVGWLKGKDKMVTWKEALKSLIWEVHEIKNIGWEVTKNPAEVSIHRAKMLARDILEAREEITEAVMYAIPELVEADMEELLEVVIQHIRFLERFREAYNACTAYDTSMRSFYYQIRVHTPDLPRKPRTQIRTANILQEKNPTLIAIVLIGILISFVPITIAWQRLTNEIATTSDADFYVQIQSSSMQLLGIFTTLYPLYKKPTGVIWYWSLAFAVSGGICALATAPLYVLVPVKWVTLLSFFGASSQVILALMLGLTTETVIIKMKDD